MTTTVRHGDPTTTHGFVIAFSSTIYDDSKNVALSGDEATCGNCKGTFKIFGTGQGMSEKGRVVVVDGDLVLCPCNRNRVIVGNNPGIFLQCDDGQSSGTHIRKTATVVASSSAVYDEQVCATAPGTLLAGYPYYVEVADGRIESGRIDTSGRLPRIVTGNNSDSYTVFWGDEALAKQFGV
ncbi:PAAR motif-containing protein [Paraburkholderia sp. RAU2J]|uniref:PAAR domain-containing protein n=1 Tax=Paraburkholderia sp. RAU2J TaxID=1938810 RepID=UPI000EAD9842|nr:PAAR domain-containing protein [Paraburkholderia sp. RAU2J]RKT26394.1 PAAR motif-containing protein [Paraburkholderia sp. RAU2J]